MHEEEDWKDTRTKSKRGTSQRLSEFETYK